MSNFIRFKPNPITDYLVDNWQTILKEYLEQQQKLLGINLLEIQHRSNKLNPITLHEKVPLYEGNIISSGLMVRKEALSVPEALLLNWKPKEEVRFFEENFKGAPTLFKWLRQHMMQLSSVTFYTAQPGAIINHHYGTDTNQVNLRLHLCLTQDPNCVFDIENERWSWKEGDLFGFDDSLLYHGIKHKGSRPRTILSIDIKKDYIKEFAINWEPRKFVPRVERIPPTIIDW